MSKGNRFHANPVEFFRWLCTETGGNISTGAYPVRRYSSLSPNSSRKFRDSGSKSAILAPSLGTTDSEMLFGDILHKIRIARTIFCAITSKD